MTRISVAECATPGVFLRTEIRSVISLIWPLLFRRASIISASIVRGAPIAAAAVFLPAAPAFTAIELGAVGTPPRRTLAGSRNRGAAARSTRGAALCSATSPLDARISRNSYDRDNRARAITTLQSV